MSVGALCNKLTTIERQIKRHRDCIVTAKTESAKAHAEITVQMLIDKQQYIMERIVLEKEHEARRRDEYAKAKAEAARYKAEEKAKYQEAKAIYMAEVREQQKAERATLRAKKATAKAEAARPTAVQAWLAG